MKTSYPLLPTNWSQTASVSLFQFSLIKLGPPSHENLANTHRFQIFHTLSRILVNSVSSSCELAFCSCRCVWSRKLNESLERFSFFSLSAANISVSSPQQQEKVVLSEHHFRSGWCHDTGWIQIVCQYYLKAFSIVQFMWMNHIPISIWEILLICDIVFLQRIV